MVNFSLSNFDTESPDVFWLPVSYKIISSTARPNDLEKKEWKGNQNGYLLCLEVSLKQGDGSTYLLENKNRVFMSFLALELFFS